MATRIGKALQLVSVAAFVGAICVYALANRVDCGSQQIQLGPGVYVSAQRRGLDGRLVLFNDLKYGPHRGIDAYHAIDIWRPLPGIEIWSSSGGLMPPTRWWTVSASLLYPIGLLALPSVALLLWRRQDPGRGFPVGGKRGGGPTGAAGAAGG